MLHNFHYYTKENIFTHFSFFFTLHLSDLFLKFVCNSLKYCKTQYLVHYDLLYTSQSELIMQEHSYYSITGLQVPGDPQNVHLFKMYISLTPNITKRMFNNQNKFIYLSFQKCSGCILPEIFST